MRDIVESYGIPCGDVVYNNKEISRYDTFTYGKIYHIRKYQVSGLYYVVDDLDSERSFYNPLHFIPLELWREQQLDKL